MRFSWFSPTFGLPAAAMPRPMTTQARPSLSSTASSGLASSEMLAPFGFWK